ncbi:16S rRNA (guanine(966)-N(2))-methyltransferase RsmD [Halomonas sp. WWR20]
MSRRQSTSRTRHAQRSAPPGQGKGPGKLRIIGGQYRRRLLPVLDSPGLRPTPDRVRETLFNWLSAVTAGCRALDLYAGTGALGIEALSRGAHEVVFVERASRVAQALQANLDTLAAPGRVVTQDAEHFLAGPATPFGLVFLDPPFRQGLAQAACTRLDQAGWLEADAFVYVETESELDFSAPSAWLLHREIRAGDSIGRLYRVMP